MDTLVHASPGSSSNGSAAAAQAERILAADPAAVPQARQFARETLTAWDLGHLSEDVSAVVTELAANAVREGIAVGRGRVLVRVSRTERLLFLQVGDRSHAAPPQPADPARCEASEHGRGLRIAAALAWRLGWYVDSGRWKIVWAAFAVRTPGTGEASGAGARAGAAA